MISTHYHCFCLFTQKCSETIKIPSHTNTSLKSRIYNRNLQIYLNKTNITTILFLNRESRIVKPNFNRTKIISFGRTHAKKLYFYFIFTVLFIFPLLLCIPIIFVFLLVFCWFCGTVFIFHYFSFVCRLLCWLLV